MARRAGSALAALLALAAIAMPVAVLASPAAAAPAGTAGVAIAITSMTPQQAVPGSTVTVAGTLTNTSQKQLSHLSVQLLGSSTPVTSMAGLQASATALYGPASTLLPGASWRTTSRLRPGTTVPWSITVKASAIGMTTFGVYPLAAQAQTTLVQAPLATSTTYLPYVPSKKGPYGYTIPARAKISWVWPLIDTPLLDEPWQRDCQGAQAQALATSLGIGGRLGQLLDAGASGAGTADAYAAADGLGRAAEIRAVRSQPSQSLASYDAVTWAVDPALLANVQALTTCGGSEPKWAQAAQRWLAELRRLSSGQPLFVTPYGDPDVAALIGSGLGSDVTTSFQQGRRISGSILNRDVSPPAAGTASTAAQTQAAGIAWPAGGTSGYPASETIAILTAEDQIGTMLVGSSPVPGDDAAVVQMPNGGGGFMKVVLADAALTGLLGSGGGTPAASFTTSQEFLADTALLAQQDPGEPIVVAPPQRWDPATGLASRLLADSASAAWLSPVSLTSLTSVKNIPVVPRLPGGTGYRKVGKRELRLLSLADAEIAQLLTMKKYPNPELYLAVSAMESSAWPARSQAMLGELRMLGNQITQQESGVQIVAESRVTLGGLKGSVPVSIDNQLGYAVQVRLHESLSPASGIKITAKPDGLVSIPQHTAITIHLRVQATQVGSSIITMSLENRDAVPLGSGTTRMTVHATQVGVLGAIIGAVALGIFLVASAARAVRRGGPRPAPDQAADPGLAGDQASDQAGDRSAEEAEPDTVMAERTELGTAGAPGP